MSIPSEYFIYINAAIIVLYIILAIIGYKKGFLYELLALVYSFASIFVSWLFSPVLASSIPIISLENASEELSLINKMINIEKLFNEAIYFVLIFLALKLFYIVLSLVFKKVNKVPVIGSFNKVFGIVIGILNATLITIVVSMLLTLPIISNGKEVINNTLFKYINTYTNKFVSIIIDNYDISSIEETYKDFDAEAIREQLKTWLIQSSDNE